MGGDDDVPCTCTHVSCYATDGVGGGWVGMMMFLALAHMCHATPLMGWVGGGGDDDVPCTCTHVSCYATDGGGWGVGGDDDVPCACTHASCYATDGVGGGWVGMMMFLALAHMCHATPLMGWVGGGWG